MKKLLLFIPVVLTILVIVPACSSDDNWKDYSEWRQENEDWLVQQGGLLDENGQAYYQRIVPVWDRSAYIYMHYFNDRSKTQDNLVPLYTSTVSVKYIGRLYNDEPFDSSFNATDSLFNTTLGAVIPGWTIALQHMHVGDSVRVLIPYQQGYGTSASGSILPYSALQFDIKLVDIPLYEIK